MSLAYRKPTAAEIRERARAEDAARQAALYGTALAAVTLLRKRGYTITREPGGIQVDDKVLTIAEVEALARREASLAGMPPVRTVAKTASGLKIGDRVALTPKRVDRGLVPAVPRKLSGAAAAAQTRAAEHSTELGERPRVVWLDLALLDIDKRYQREIGQAGAAHINRILRGFNWNLYQPIVVSQRDDGRCVVIDGQHRLEAAKKHPLISELPCYIVDAPDLAAQAAIFSSVNGQRLGLTSQQKFFASVAAGEESAVVIDRLCRDAGVEILRTNPGSNMPPRAILAPFTLQKLLRQVGSAPLVTALKLLAETHGETRNAFRSPTIAALTRIAAAREFGRRRMAAVLKGLDLDVFYADARQERIAGGGTLETAAERVLRRSYETSQPRSQ